MDIHAPAWISTPGCGHYEGLPNWRLQNALSDCIYQNDEKSLRRSLSEIKNYEEMYIGLMVSYLQMGTNIGILISFFQAVVRYHYVHVRI